MAQWPTLGDRPCHPAHVRLCLLHGIGTPQGGNAGIVAPGLLQRGFGRAERRFRPGDFLRTVAVPHLEQILFLGCNFRTEPDRLKFQRRDVNTGEKLSLPYMVAFFRQKFRQASSLFERQRYLTDVDVAVELQLASGLIGGKAAPGEPAADAESDKNKKNDELFHDEIPECREVGSDVFAIRVESFFS